MEDLSNKAIFILVILTVVISMFSTWLLLSISLEGGVSSPISQSLGPSSSGSMSYNIQHPEKTEDSTSGSVSVNIVNPNEINN